MSSTVERPVPIETTQGLFDTLDEEEFYWKDSYNWLLESGYRLRPRYHPDWIASWRVNPELDALHCEDSIGTSHSAICDAIRIDGNSPVILKRVSREDHPHEIEIIEYLMEEPRKSDPMNHSLPVIEVLQPPDASSESILVMPLCRAWDSPEFETVGEVVDCIRQLIEGVQFLHENVIAHRDLKTENFMMNTRLYTMPFHPMTQDRAPDGVHNVGATYTRTQRRPRYYIIDYGLARRYEQSQMPPAEATTGIFGSNFTVPEFQTPDKPHNPFLVDVYCLGCMIRDDILEEEPENLGFGCVVPLLEDMTDEIPANRPSMEEVLLRFDAAISTLSVWTLRSRFTPTRLRYEWYDRVLRAVPYLLRQIQFVLNGTPAIPR